MSEVVMGVGPFGSPFMFVFVGDAMGELLFGF